MPRLRFDRPAFVGLRLAVALLFTFFLAGRVAAAPHLTITTTASRDTIHPLETIDYAITVRHDGDGAPTSVRLTNRIPTSAMLVAAPPEWEVEDSRQLSWMGSIEPGRARTFRLSFVTREESAGMTLSNMTEANYGGRYENAFHDMEIESPPTKGGLTNAGVVVLAYLAFAAVAMFVIKTMTRGRFVFSGWLLIFICIGFLLFFVDLARDDARMKRTFVESRCTVLDSLARFHESPSTKSGDRGGSFEPVFAVRYPTNAGEQVSIGYASASALQFGSPKPAQLALARLPRGGQTPCWYDPEDPTQVVLTRDIGGAYGFAVIPLIGIAYAVFLIRR